MIRTQISLTEEQHRRLKRVARERGVSLAEVVREAVDQVVPDQDEERRRAWERLMSLAGAFDSGVPDIAERHDDYLPDHW
jgi:hypothetical protein